MNTYIVYDKDTKKFVKDSGDIKKILVFNNFDDTLRFAEWFNKIIIKIFARDINKFFDWMSIDERKLHPKKTYTP